MAFFPRAARGGKVGCFSVEGGAAESETSELEASARLFPLRLAWHEACGFTERALYLPVEIAQGSVVQLGGDHPHVVAEFAHTRTITKEPSGNLGVLDVGDLF